MAKLGVLDDNNLLVEVRDVPDDPEPVTGNGYVVLSPNTDMADHVWKYWYDWDAGTFLPVFSDEQ